MTTLDRDDLLKVVCALPKWLKEHMANSRVFVAGGFIRSLVTGEKITDLDLFAADNKAVDRLQEEAKEHATGCFSTEFARTYTCNGRLIQVIRAWTFKTADELLSHFDFTISGACVWSENPDGYWTSEVSPNFYSDLAARRLRYTGSNKPGGSLLRVLKFVRRGYHIAPEELAQIVAEVAEIDPTKVVYALREIDPESAAAVAAMKQIDDQLGEEIG